MGQPDRLRMMYGKVCFYGAKVRSAWAKACGYGAKACGDGIGRPGWNEKGMPHFAWARCGMPYGGVGAA